MKIKKDFAPKIIFICASIFFLSTTKPYLLSGISDSRSSLRNNLMTDAINREEEDQRLISVLKQVIKKTRREEIEDRLSVLKVIKDKKPDEITEEDRSHLMQIGAHFNLPYEVEMGSTDIGYSSSYSRGFLILTSAELTSLNYPEVSSYAIDVMKGITTIAFGHAFTHIYMDLDAFQGVCTGFAKTIDTIGENGQETQKTSKRIESIVYESVLTVKGWSLVIQSFEYSNIQDSKIILALIDSLIEYIDEVARLKIDVEKFFRSHSDKIDKKLFVHFLDMSNKAQNMCSLKINELQELKQHIHQGHENSLVDINNSIKKSLKMGENIKNIEIRLDFDKNIPYIYANSPRIFYIWENLLMNSLDAISDAKEEGGIKKGIITVKTHIIDRNQRKFIEVIYRDNGIGIPGWLLEGRRLFMPDWTSKVEGTGLGLYIIDRTMADYGGFIDVRNIEQGGAEFVLQFPVITEYQQKLSETVDSLKNTQKDI